PINALADRESFVTQVPAFAIQLPRHYVLGSGHEPFDVRLKRLNCFGQKLPKFRRIDFAEAVHKNADCLPGAPQVIDLDSVLVAVGLNSGSLIKGPDAESLYQPLLLERVPADAEDQADAPFHARHRVQEPAVALVRCSDLDDAAMVPVRLAKCAGGAY